MPRSACSNHAERKLQTVHPAVTNLRGIIRRSIVSKRVSLVLFAAVLLAVGIPQANASSFSFTFDSLGINVTNAGLQTYMNGVLVGIGSVSVGGNPITDKTYNGDGHVVGNTCTAAHCTSSSSTTLGTDTFVRNVAGQTAFSFTFTLTDAVIDSVSFDYEIFPDGTCPSTEQMRRSGCEPAGLHVQH